MQKTTNPEAPPLDERVVVDPFENEVEAATIRLLRITLVFGLTCAAAIALAAVTFGSGRVEVAATLIWAAIWAGAVARPASVAWLLRQHPLGFAVCVILVSVAMIVVTGGTDSPTIVDANWIIWSASVVVGARVVLSFATALGASHFAAFVIAGMPIEHAVSGSDAYQVVTQVLNPLVIAAAALALTGVFRNLLSQTPELLARWRAAPTQTLLSTRRLLELPPGATGSSADYAGPDHQQLTPAEADVVERLAMGAKPKQIAHDTSRSVATIYEHIANAKRKVAARTTAQLVTRAWRPVE